MSNAGKDWVDLAKRRDKLEGTRIVDMIKNLALSQYILNRNYNDLIEIFNYYQKDKEIWDIKNRPKLGALQKELLRLVHNYLASIYSLVEHTYVFRGKLNNKEFENFCNEKINKLKTDISITFLKDLRVYTQHYKLPFLEASISFKMINSKKREAISEQNLFLDKEQLLKWDRWSSISKSYLNKQDDKIDIKIVIQEHQKIIKNFYGLFYNKIAKLYEKEIMELSNLEREMFDLESQLIQRNRHTEKT